MSLKQQIKADRVNPDPDTRAMLDLDRELATPPPPLRDPHESTTATVDEFMDSLGLEAEQRRFARRAIEEVSHDTRKALGIYRDGKRYGVEGVKLSEIIREAVIRGQERIRSLNKAQQSDPLARFYGLKALAGTPGLKVRGAYKDGEHGHDHLDALSTQIGEAVAKQASNPAGGGAEGGEPEVDHAAHAALHSSAAALNGLEAMPPYADAYKQLLAEVQQALKNPSEVEAGALAARVKALVRLLKHQAEASGEVAKSLALDVRTGRLISTVGPAPEPHRSAAEVASDLRSRLGVFATADQGAIRLCDLTKSQLPADAVACPRGGWLLDPVTAEGWLHRSIVADI